MTTQSTYNGDGHRTARTVNGTKTRYTLDLAAGLVQILVETAGNQITTYLHPSDSPFIPPRTSGHN